MSENLERVFHTDGEFTRERFDRQRFSYFGSVNCVFNSCDFSSTVIESFSTGAGKSQTIYRDCSFDDATLTMYPGGICRFENCSFRGTRIINWMCFATEVVGCIFTGEIRRAIFNGAVSDQYAPNLSRATNEFRDNDFSEAKLFDVAFRTGIDLRAQRLPTGDDYVYLSDTAVAAERLAGLLDVAGEEDRRVVSPVLESIRRSAGSAQRQVLLRPKDYARAARPAIDRYLREVAKVE